MVLCGFYTGFIGFACGFSQPPAPCPHSHQVKAKPTLMVLIDEIMVSLRREPCGMPLLMAFLVFLTPPGPSKAKTGSQLC